MISVRQLVVLIIYNNEFRDRVVCVSYERTNAHCKMNLFSTLTPRHPLSTTHNPSLKCTFIYTRLRHGVQSVRSVFSLAAFCLHCTLCTHRRWHCIGKQQHIKYIGERVQGALDSLSFLLLFICVRAAIREFSFTVR